MAQNLRRMQYAVRGEVVMKAETLQQQGREVRVRATPLRGLSRRTTRKRAPTSKTTNPFSYNLGVRLSHLPLR